MLKITDKKRFTLVLFSVLALVGLFSWGVFWFFTRPEILKFKDLENSQKEELKNSVTNKNLSVFQFADAKSEEKKRGEMKLTATENNEHGSKESQFVFGENYADGYKFTQNNFEIQIIPKNSQKTNLKRKVVSQVDLGGAVETNTGQMAVYENGEEKHLFSFSDETNTLKNWSYYEKPQEQIEESWEFKGAILKKNEDNSIEVYRLPVQKDSQNTAANLEPDMAERIANTLKEELGDDYYFQKKNYLFSIPAPFYLTKTGERKTPEVAVENQNQLRIKFNSQKEEFPILLDPTITLSAKMDALQINGDSASDNFGYSVSGAGDVNGDGKEDVIVGAYADDDGGSDSGSAFIFYGGAKTTGSATSRADVKITGENAYDNFGLSVSGAGDMNGDGKDDVIVGSTGYASTGAAYIFYGGVTSGTAAAKVNIKLTGDALGDSFGFAVSAGGDINGDGRSDVVVGARNGSLYVSGAAYIFYGGVTSGVASAQANVVITGDSMGDYFGESVSGAGDVNGDGKDDVVVGAYGDDDNGTNSGSVYIFYGGVASGAASAIANVKIIGDSAFDGFGTSVSGAGDVNGDGKADVVAGANGDSDSGVGSGSIFIFYGGVASGVATTAANVKITGDSAGDEFGTSVAIAGDVNGDGKADLIAGAPYDDDNSRSNSGSIFIFYGGVTSGAATVKANIKFSGDSASDYFGYSVSGAGDVNGDGKDDVIVGAYQDDDGGSGSGSAKIYTFTDFQNSAKITGDGADDYFGFSVSSAGDVNGDGKDDVIVGATGDDDGGATSGSAFIFYGGVSSGTASGKADVKLTGDSDNDRFGYSVSGAGDVNGDGKDDVIVGAYMDDDGGDASGSAFIFYGGVTSGAATARADVKLTGEINAALGYSVSGAGDVNGDGKADVIAGANGEAYIFYGGVTSGTANSRANVKLTDDSGGDDFGSSVSGAGDVNSDGKSDVIVGAPYDDDGGSNSGSAFIFYGGVTSGAATAKANVKITGDSANDYFGSSVSSAGDVNGDGKDDVIVGAPNDDDGGTDSGSAFIFYGGVSGGSATAKANIKLTGVDNGDQFGSSVSDLGDVNGDGKDDVAVAIDDYNSDFEMAYIFYGGVTSGTATARSNFTMTSDSTDDWSGRYVVSGAGDVNGDGKADVIFGANFDDDGGNNAGAALIFTLGPSGEMEKITGDSASDSFGSSVSGAGDVNGDGKDDVIVGAPYDDNGGSNSGSVFIFYGGVSSGTASGKADVKITGDSADDNFGASVSLAGDVNGDGKDDVIAGAPYDDDGGAASGSAFIFYGGVTSGGATAKADVKLYGDAANDFFGSAVSGAGDVNGDGKDDVIVGATGDDDGGAASGSAFIFYGGVTSGGATTKANVKLTGDEMMGNFGCSVSGAGDVNGDGKADVIIGANLAGGFNGAAYIFYGGVTSGAASTVSSVKLTGDSAGDYFGNSVSGAGDVNGDGKEDVIVGASHDDDGESDSGSAFIFYGGVASGVASTVANVKITGDSASDVFGHSVSGAGDVNGDGKDDVIVGAFNDDDGGSNSGSTFIFYGGVSSGAATEKADAKLLGEAADDMFGRYVSGAGDVNGDGKADIIIGATGDDDGGDGSGSVKIISDLATKDNPDSPNFEIVGDSAGDNFGWSVSGAGDVNGDGKDDVIVGASGDDDGGSLSGSAFIFYGGTGNGSASSLADVKLTGEAINNYFGRSVSGAGDVNGDGKADVIVGAYGYSSSTGAAYIFYGGVTSGTAASRYNVRLTGDSVSDAFGISVSGAGDVNSDGKDDVVVGASYDDDGGSNSGSAYIFYGGVTSGAATTRANVKLIGDSAGDYFGRHVSDAGDVNGDGKYDVIVGVPHDDDSGEDSGSVFIFYGGVTSGVATSRASVKLIADAAFDYFGVSVSGAGDVNGDGKDDLVVGASQYWESNYDRVFVFYGGVTSGNAGDKADAIIYGDTDWIDNFGNVVSGAGDVNGDGKDDIIVGEDRDEDSSDNGAFYIFYGGNIKSGLASAVADVKFNGSSDDFLGSSVSGAGDINGDGLADVVVGSFWGPNLTGNGFVRILYGHRLSPKIPTSLTPTSGTYTFSQSVNINCSGGTYNSTQNKFGQTIVWDIEAFYAGAWHELTNDDVDGQYAWSITGIVPEPDNVQLRCRQDIFGLSGGFSPWLLTRSIGLDIVQGGEEIRGRVEMRGGVQMR